MIYVYAVALYDGLISEGDIPDVYYEKSIELYKIFKEKGISII